MEDDMDWRDQVAVVTGGGRGIGRATAKLLAARGAAVAVNYTAHSNAAEAVVADIKAATAIARPPAALISAEAVVADIKAAGGRAIAVAADVSDAAAVEAMIARVQAELGAPSILVNNAG